MHIEEAKKAIDPMIDKARVEGLLLVGFKAWAAPDAPGFRAGLRERLGAKTTRAVWDDPERRGARIALRVIEHASSRQALDGLAETLAANQLADVPRGPDDLGVVSFAHPQGVPPAVFFVRGNLTLLVTSFGNEAVDVLPFARTVDRELTSRPREFREGGIELTAPNLKTIEIKPRWAGEDAYIKVIAQGAELTSRGGTVEIAGDAGVVEVFVIERGRETYFAPAARGTR